MALSRDMKSKLALFGGANLARLIGFVDRTSSRQFDPPDMQQRFIAEQPAICACWHGQFMMLACSRPEGLKFSAMVARHGDAELIGEAMRRIGVDLIRGAGAGDRKKDRGGAYALKASMTTLKAGSSVVVTADVPPGPARKAGEGIITLARLSGRPILPIAAATSRYHAFKTWSRLTLNLPYSKLVFTMGDAIHVPRDASPEQLEALRQQLENQLNSITMRAYELAGTDATAATPPGARAGHLPPLPVGAGLKLYRGATRLVQAAAPAVLAYRERQGKEVRERRGERYGRSEIARPEGQLVWFHAASVGETNAILPVIEGMKARRPDLSFLLTTGTRTSARMAQERLGDTAIHQFVPLDAPGFAKRFVGHWQPDAAVFTESEVWPNLILETSAANIPLVLINARMSKRSYHRWRKRPGLSAPLFNRFDLVLSQNARFARWFKELGARHVEVAGNLKIDAPPLPIDMQAFDKLVQAVEGRRGYIAASTHPGEDEIIADAHRLISSRFEGFLTIIAPRHPERGTAIAEMLKSKGLRVTQRSLNELPDRASEVYVADTIGEMGTFYALCPIALLGGSLVDKGGQNPIEAIRHGSVVLTGPSCTNFVDVYEGLKSNGAIGVVKSSEELAQNVIELLADEGRLEDLRAKGVRAVDKMAGALDLTVTALLNRLPPRETAEKELDRAS
ncbi:MAG: glycosyltransferase N-terminal domain-containing protein [Filomicrobium sp.]